MAATETGIRQETVKKTDVIEMEIFYVTFVTTLDIPSETASTTLRHNKKPKNMKKSIE